MTHSRSSQKSPSCLATSIRSFINLVENAELVGKEMRFFHGTTSRLAAVIQKGGFRDPVFLTPHFEDAAEYAMMGGEQDLQDREERYHAEHGEWPRDIYDTAEMYHRLYPEGETPVVIEITLTPEEAAATRPDPHGGPSGNVVLDRAVPPSRIVRIHQIEWPEWVR